MKSTSRGRGVNPDDRPEVTPVKNARPISAALLAVLPRNLLLPF